MRTLILIWVLGIPLVAQTPPPKHRPHPRSPAVKPTPPAVKPTPPVPLPADVSAFKDNAKAAGAKSYEVRCMNGACVAVAKFADGSQLVGRGASRQDAMASMDFTKPHPVLKTSVSPNSERYAGTL